MSGNVCHRVFDLPSNIFDLMLLALQGLTHLFGTGGAVCTVGVTESSHCEIYFKNSHMFEK